MTVRRNAKSTQGPTVPAAPRRKVSVSPTVAPAPVGNI